MAKVTGPLNSSAARGRVGNLVYNTWRGIHTVKTSATPTTQYSNDQIALRTLTAAATLAWQAASDAQRVKWNVYAADHPDSDWTGNAKRLSGYNWFVRLNVRAQLVGQSIQNEPPPPTILAILEDFHLEWADTDIIACRWTPVPWPPWVYTWVEFYFVDAHSAGRTPNLPEADRKGYEGADYGIWLRHTMPPGNYTAFARIIVRRGLVGPWSRAFLPAW